MKHAYDDDFKGIIAEFYTWYNLADDSQKETLIQSLRHCADLIDEDMPQIEKE